MCLLVKEKEFLTKASNLKNAGFIITNREIPTLMQQNLNA